MDFCKIIVICEFDVLKLGTYFTSIIRHARVFHSVGNVVQGLGTFVGLITSYENK